MKILITGASSGFGKLTVNTLIRNGHEVAASMRAISGRNKANADELASLGAHIVEIDVTDEESVNLGVAAAIEKLSGIDVLINNAGVGVLGFQEQFTTDDFQKLFEINLFGVQRMNRAVIPHFRKQGSGLLVHISSILGRMALPFYGPYNASKWALEALAENYRLELSAFGIDSSLVEPGGFPTSFMDSLIRPSDASRNESYGEYQDAPTQLFEGFEQALNQNPEQNPQLVADAVLKLIATPAGQRPMRTVVDKMGMGDHVAPYNDQLGQITSGVLSAFGMGDMLVLKN